MRKAVVGLSAAALAALAAFLWLSQVNKGPQRQSITLAALLTTGTPTAKDSFYSCIYNDYAQGISLKQGREDCLVKLNQDSDKGFEKELGEIGKASKPFFDPSKITANCSSGNAKVGQSGFGQANRQNWGSYSWGGNPNDYWGYTPEKSMELKDKAIKEAKEAQEDYKKAEAKVIEAMKEQIKAIDAGDKKKEAEAIEKEKIARKELEAKREAAVKKQDDARKDPNKKPPPSGKVAPTPLPNSRPVADPSSCQLALESAREILRECNRNGWKSSDCQELQAKLNKNNGCPDPTHILVDPEQGYACGSKIDGEALKSAWTERCEQLKRFGPGGDNPCRPPQMEKSGRVGLVPNVCADPLVYVDPGSGECYGTVEIHPFGEPDIQHLIVWGLNTLGGPIIVINRDPPPSPKPGPEPKPGPGPGPIQ